MNIKHPISAAIPSLDGAVLEALDRTTEALSLSRAFELTAEGSLSGVRKVLTRLVAAGVVDSSGSPPRYRLNRDHLAYPAISALAQLRSTLQDRIASVVAQWSPPPHMVGVFGSFARGEGSIHSDIDVLILGEPTSDQIADLALSIGRWTGNEAHLVVLSAAELSTARARGEAIVDEWERDLIVIYGDERTLGLRPRRADWSRSQHD